MKNITFVIITYGHQYLKTAIESIKQYYPELDICIINNKQNSNINITQLGINYDNIYCYNNDKNNFELGALWKAYEIVGNKYKKFIVIQNSMIIQNRFDENILNKDFVPFWSVNVYKYAPTVSIFIEKMKQINMDIKINKTWNSVTGCCCIINTKYLKELVINYNAHLLYADNKVEAVCCEIIFGYLISCLLNINLEPYYKKSLSYCMKHNSWKVLRKIGSGQGSNPQIIKQIYKFPDYIFDNRLKIINLKCKMDIWNNIMEEILVMIDNKNIKLIDLVNKHNISIQYKSNIININNILASIHHYLYVKYFFPNEFIKIINKYKLKLDSPYDN